MQPLKMAAVLLMCCSAVSACEPKRIATALPIPPERMDCEAATGKRPKLPPEYVIDWTKIATVGEAKTAHDNFVNVIRGREGIVSNYILTLAGDLFQCANDAAWVREWQAGTR